MASVPCHGRGHLQKGRHVAIMDRSDSRNFSAVGLQLSLLSSLCYHVSQGHALTFSTICTRHLICICWGYMQVLRKGNFRFASQDIACRNIQSSQVPCLVI